MIGLSTAKIGKCHTTCRWQTLILIGLFFVVTTTFMCAIPGADLSLRLVHFFLKHFNFILRGNRGKLSPCSFIRCTAGMWQNRLFAVLLECGKSCSSFATTHIQFSQRKI